MYQREGNDPNRRERIPSPDEVRSMLSGSDGDEERWRESFGEEPSTVFDLPSIIEEVDGVTFVDFPHTQAVYIGRPRCLTCGRTNDCCCPNCDICVLGTPRRSVGRAES